MKIIYCDPNAEAPFNDPMVVAENYLSARRLRRGTWRDYWWVGAVVAFIAIGLLQWGGAPSQPMQTSSNNSTPAPTAAAAPVDIPDGAPGGICEHPQGGWYPDASKTWFIDITHNTATEVICENGNWRELQTIPAQTAQAP